MSENLNKLKAILREMFQLDQADLDFGIYRIMNQKRDEIEKFMNKDLLPQVEAAFSGYGTIAKVSLQEELDKMKIEIERLGYHILLVFLTLPSADMALARVTSRVAQGGHNVPEADVRRRFESGVKNFHELYKNIVNAWTLYDNSGTAPRVIERGSNDE